MPETIKKDGEKSKIESTCLFVLRFNVLVNNFPVMSEVKVSYSKTHQENMSM